MKALKANRQANLALRALSIRPPWAWAIAHAGEHIENRSWTTKYRGPLAIHASLSFKDWELELLENILGRRIDPSRFVTGAIVATARLADVVPLGRCSSRWAVGPFCWVLRDIRPLARPIYVTGSLGLWYAHRRCSRSQIATLLRSCA
jgi:hypothetical protein